MHHFGIEKCIHVWDWSIVRQNIVHVGGRFWIHRQHVNLTHACRLSSSTCIYWRRAPSQYQKRRFSVRSRKVSKPRDWYFKLPYRFEIWQAHRQHCCRSACQISERSDNSKYKSRGFETLRDLTERRLFGYWDGALVPIHAPHCCFITQLSSHQSKRKHML